MTQLALFEGPHVPRTAAREAVSRGDFAAAQEQLAGLADAKPEAADAIRLGRLDSALQRTGRDPAATVHAAFEAALSSTGRPGFLSSAEWFRSYARQMATALTAEPNRRYRGWLGAHFAFAAGELDEARRIACRITETQPPGPAWVEAARIEFELGDPANARSWIQAACLGSAMDLDLTAPTIENCGVSVLDEPPTLPSLPAAVEDLFDVVRESDDLPAASTRWVAVVGEIDRVLAPLNAGEATTHPGPDGDPVLAFLAALRAARRSRERDHPRGPEHCSDRELRARRQMQRLAPSLLDRYVHGTSESLF